MKKIIFPILGLLLIAGSISCQEKIDIEADEQALIKLTAEEWDMNAKAGNLKNVDHYTDDAIRIGNGGIYEGKEAIGKLLQSYNEATILLMENKVEKIWVSGDLATVRGSFLGSIILKESGDTLHLKKAWVNVCERQSDGTWRMVLTIGTDLND